MPMPDDPIALDRIDSLSETITRAHGVIYNLHSALVERDRADANSRSLLSESIAIVLSDASAATRTVLVLAQDAEIRQLLGNSDAELDRELAKSVREAEAELLRLLQRQEEIADELRARVAGD